SSRRERIYHLGPPEKEERQRWSAAAPRKEPPPRPCGWRRWCPALGRWDPGGSLQASPIGFRRELAHHERRPGPRWTAIGHEVVQPITQSRQGKAQEPGNPPCLRVCGAGRLTSPRILARPRCGGRFT